MSKQRDGLLGVNVGLSINFFVFFFLISIVNIYLPKVLDLNGFSSKEIGDLRAYSYAFGVTAPMIYSQLSQKFGRRLALQIGFILSCLLIIPLFFKLNFWLFAILITLQYFFMQGCNNQLDSLALNTLADKNDYGKIRASGSLGFVFFAVSGGWLADHYGLFNLMWYIVLTQVLLIFAIFIMPCDSHVVNVKLNSDKNNDTANNTTKATDTDKATDNKSENDNNHKPTIKPVNEDKFPITFAFVLLMIFIIFQYIGRGVYMNFFLIYATGELGYSNATSSLIMSTGVVAEIIGLLGASYVLRLVNTKILLVAVGLFTALRWYLQGFMGHSLILLLISQTFHIFTFSFLHTATLKFINDNFKNTKDIGTAIGIYGSIGLGIGSIIGSVLAGRTWDFGPQTAYTYAVAFSLASSVVAVFIKPYADKQEDDIIEYDLHEYEQETRQNNDQDNDIRDN